MEVPLWFSLLLALVAGVFGGIVGPGVTDWLNRRRWRAEKTLELKFDVLSGALSALAWWESDALDAELQSDKATFEGKQKVVELRPQTAQSLQHNRSLVATLFSDEVAEKYDLVLKCRISIDQIPYTEFEEKRNAFIQVASRDLGLIDS